MTVNELIEKLQALPKEKMGHIVARMSGGDHHWKIEDVLQIRDDDYEETVVLD